IEDKLSDTFTYDELQRFVREIKEEQEDLSYDSQILIQQMLWLASSHYEISYSRDTSISERVIFPISDTEKTESKMLVLYSLFPTKGKQHTMLLILRMMDIQFFQNYCLLRILSTSKSSL